MQDGVTHDGVCGFIDPFSSDANDYFDFMENGEVRAKKAPAAYLIGMFHLNRSFLVNLRVVSRLMSVAVELAERIIEIGVDADPDDAQDLARLVILINQFSR